MPSTVKRPGDDALDASQPMTKFARLDSSTALQDNCLGSLGGDPGSGKRKAVGSSRTGQACDRCKVRKIRCDARPGGCSPCMQNQTECKTTDRITGRATSRGHTENLEHENTTLRLYMIELQAQLKEHGIEPRVAPVISPSGRFTSSSTSPFHSNGPWEGSQADGTVSASKPDAQQGQNSQLPEFRSGCIGDNYLGVVSENDWLSPIEGTSLSLFGTKIDLADFMPQESTFELDAMSYETFLDHAFGRRPHPPEPQLPEYDSCKVFADWYFRSITPFVPILHKPDFMHMLDRIYLENYEASPAEKVMVHMMLALMNFQWSARNKSEQSRRQSFEHYHFSLGFIPELIAGHQLADLQALALICAQLRNQPRTGAAWWFTNTVMALVVESGLHRSVKAWHGSGFTPHVVEMRKRVFWSVLMIHVSMSGKLGRPMPLRLEDFDVELPEPLPDHLPGENLPKWKRCSFRCGIQGMKMVKILMGVYSTIYSVRSSNGPYEVHVRQLEQDLKAFKAQLPSELAAGPQTREEERVFSLYLQMTEAEIQLLLHHPSLCRSQSSQTVSANLDTCLQASNTLLATAAQLKQLKSLDTTWYTTMSYLAAIFTTLFAHHERREHITTTDSQNLRRDMASWLDVLGEVGQLLGSGQRLQNAVGAIVDHSLNVVSAHVAAKTASSAVASADSSTHVAGSNYNESDEYADESADDQRKLQLNSTLKDTYVLADQPDQAIQQPDAYTHAEFRYHDGQNTALSTYTQMNSFGTSHYGQDDIKPALDAHLNAIVPPQTLPATGSHANMQNNNSYMASFSPSHPHENDYHNMSNTPLLNLATYQQTGGPAAWRTFAMNVMSNITEQDYLNNTASLVAHSNIPRTSDMTGFNMTMPMQMAANPMNPNAQQGWPFIQYATGPLGGH